MKLSVIVVTKSRARHLGSCLDSIAAAFALAAPLDAEIVIVDNGSTDNTAALIDEWASRPISAASSVTSSGASSGRKICGRRSCGRRISRGACWEQHAARRGARAL